MKISKILEEEVADLLDFLDSPARAATDQFEVVESRLDSFRFFLRTINGLAPDSLPAIQEWFRKQTEPWFSRSAMMSRARSWPEGYPGDYRTLEAVYANEPSGGGIGLQLDRYFLSRTLAVAVRSRCRHLSRLLIDRAAVESGPAAWLNLACGSCRELLPVPPPTNTRRIFCVDSDANALGYAQRLLVDHDLGELQPLVENAYRFTKAQRNIKRFGEFTTIYSAGLFDYLPSGSLSSLLGGLYQSLASGGVLIAPFKDCTRYETFDYHWLVCWNYFLQRDEAELRSIFTAAGIPDSSVNVERDDTGVLLFFTIIK